MVKKLILTDSSKSCSTKGKDLRTHYKNTYQVGKAIKGMLIKKAEAYLKEVLDHKKCIPYTKYDGSMGRTGQALQFGLTKGRWPEKSIKIVLGLLKNAEANAEAKKLDVEKLVVKKVIKTLILLKKIMLTVKHILTIQLKVRELLLLQLL